MGESSAPAVWTGRIYQILLIMNKEKRKQQEQEDIFSYYAKTPRERSHGGFKNNYNKDTPGKLIYTVKDKVADFVNMSMDEFKQAFANLDDKDKCDIMVKMMQYVIPRVSEQTLNANVKTDTVQDEIAKLAGTTISDTEDPVYEN